MGDNEEHLCFMLCYVLCYFMLFYVMFKKREDVC